jgi:hypothetical protein
MRKYYTILLFFVSFFAFSQNNGINFQGVGRNSSGAVLATQKISLRFTVLQGSETGAVEYVESKEVTTNAQGIFSVVIGDGTQISKTGNFADINWKINPKFLKVEMDPAGGSSFAAMGTTRLQSVPFAYYANGVNAENVDGVLSASKGGTGVASISALKTALGVDQINNTSDLAKPISTATHAALDTKVDKVDGKELSTNDYTTTEKNKLAAVSGTNTGDQDLSGLATISQLTGKANISDLALKAPLASPTFTGIVSGITKAMVGLSNVENTSDLAKPISSATQTALDLKVSTTTLALKENVANKSAATDLGGLNPSDILFPTQKAVKDYVTANAASGGIADGGVKSIKIANGAVGNNQLASNSINSTNIIDGTITNADINTNASIPFSKLNITKANIESLGIPGSDQNTTYAAGSGLTLSGTTFSIGSGAITSTLIADGTISNVDISNSAAIDYSKLNLAGTIVSADISNSAAIPFSKLNIAKSDIESLGIPGSDENTTYTAGSGLSLNGTTFSIGTGAITSTLIADGTISNVDVNSSAAIDYSKLNLAGSIISADISNSAAIPFSKLNIAKSDIESLGIPGSDENTTYTAGSGLSLNGTTFSINSSVLTSNYGGSALINGNITANAFIGDGSNLTNIASLSDNIVSSSKITDGTITTSDLADASITNSKISGPVTIVNGGTGTSTLLTNGVILGNGTNTVQFVAPGASGNVLKSNGTTWISEALSGGGATSLDNLSDAKVEGSSGSYDFTGGLLLGHKNLSSLYLGLRTTAVGIGAVQNLNNGSDNTAIGYNSMKLLHQGDLNTAVGSQALYSVYSGSYNIAVGFKSLYNNTASQNVAMGYFSLFNNTTGELNTAVGSQALQTNVSGNRNTAIGHYSLGTSTGNYNTATGFYSLYQNTTGYGNSGFGLEALASNTTGYYNTSIGYQSGMSMTSGNNNTLIGYNSQPSSGSVNNEITLGNASITTLRSMVTSITSLSDRRDKTDIIEISEGLNFIKQLKPVSFTWNTRDKSKVGIKSAGFIAQDLLSLQKSSSIGENLDLVSENNPDKLEARYNNLLPVMVKAIQDQQTIIEQLKKELAELKQLIQNK